MKNVCSISGCTGQYKALGFCVNHYWHNRKYGNPLSEREILALTIPLNCIPLTQGKFAIVDEADFEWLNQWKWYFNMGYAMRRDEKGNSIPMHRQILDLTTREDGLVDHINQNKLDNRRENIRKCSENQNHWNIPKSSVNTSGYKGVSWDKKNKRWEANICHKFKRVKLGRFKNREDAAIAYNVAAQILFGDFAYLNPL